MNNKRLYKGHYSDLLKRYHQIKEHAAEDKSNKLNALIQMSDDGVDWATPLAILEAYNLGVKDGKFKNIGVKPK